MITLLASITGFISSIIPELIKYLKDINDKKHELNILDRQIEYNKYNHKNDLEEIRINQEILDQTSLYSTYKTNINWIDALNGLVRPLIAYSFFIMYITVKYIQYKAITSSAHFLEYIEVIWNLDDKTIFAGIISFYYGQRTFRKLWKDKIY